MRLRPTEETTLFPVRSGPLAGRAARGAAVATGDEAKPFLLDLS